MNKTELFEKITKEMSDLYKKKNSDYGDSVHDTYEKFGIDAFLVRMYDKINRVYSLTRTNSVQKVDEKVEDTLLDLANYSVIALVEMKKEREENK